jgi:hypothetical protein
LAFRESLRIKAGGFCLGAFVLVLKALRLKRWDESPIDPIESTFGLLLIHVSNNLNGPNIVIASEAKQSILPRKERKNGLLRGACHRARIRATRWLAMTKFSHIVPAHAGTHTPRPIVGVGRLSRNTKPRGYGSRRSPGRRRGDTRPPSRDAMRPSLAGISAPEDRGRRESRVPAAPAASCAV